MFFVFSELGEGLLNSVTSFSVHHHRDSAVRLGLQVLWKRQPAIFAPIQRLHPLLVAVLWLMELAQSLRFLLDPSWQADHGDTVA